MKSVFDSNLSIGNVSEGHNTQLLFDQEIESLVDLAYEEKPASYPREIFHLRIPLIDGQGNSRLRIRIAIISVAEIIRADSKALIFCSAGLSRSPVIVIASYALVTQSDPGMLFDQYSENYPHQISPPLWNDVLSVYTELE